MINRNFIVLVFTCIKNMCSVGIACMMGHLWRSDVLKPLVLNCVVKPAICGDPFSDGIG